MSKENFIGASLGNQKQIDTFVSTPILRDMNSQNSQNSRILVDNIPGRTEADGEGEHGGVGGAALLSLGLLGGEVHQLRAEDGGHEGAGGVHTASGENIWREHRKYQHYF